MARSSGDVTVISFPEHGKYIAGETKAQRLRNTLLDTGTLAVESGPGLGSSLLCHTIFIKLDKFL